MSRNDTWNRVQAVVVDFDAKGKRITFAAVARAAGVARGTLYNDSRLRSLVKDYQQVQQGYWPEDVLAETTEGRADEFWARGALHLDRNVSLTHELLRARLAMLSKIFHPDRGGDHDLQLSVNHAYGILKKKL